MSSTQRLWLFLQVRSRRCVTCRRIQLCSTVILTVFACCCAIAWVQIAWVQTTYIQNGHSILPLVYTAKAFVCLPRDGTQVAHNVGPCRLSSKRAPELRMG